MLVHFAASAAAADEEGRHLPPYPALEAYTTAKHCSELLPDDCLSAYAIASHETCCPPAIMPVAVPFQPSQMQSFGLQDPSSDFKFSCDSGRSHDCCIANNNGIHVLVQVAAVRASCGVVAVACS